MDWNDFARDVHQTAVEKGLWDKPRSFDDIVCECLVHLGRAYEEYRNGRPNLYYPCNAGGVCEADKTEGAMDCASRIISPEHPDIYCTAKSKTPHGAAAELGECVLRLLDYLATADVDIDAEMGFVPSGDTLPGLVCDCTRFLAKAHISTTAMDGSEEKKFFNLIMCIDVIKDWFAENNISMESILRELHACEKARAGRREGEAK